jgi:hypothetical protein
MHVYTEPRGGIHQIHSGLAGFSLHYNRLYYRLNINVKSGS